MAKFASATDALTAALAGVDARLRNIDIDTQLDLYLEVVIKRGAIQQAIGSSSSSGGLTEAATASAVNTGLTNFGASKELGGNLEGVKTAIGAVGDTTASSDAGSFSAIAFIKRSLVNWTALLARIPGLGQALSANSVPVVMTAIQVAAITPPLGVKTSALALAVQPAYADTPTTANVTASITNTVLLAANNNRKCAVISNDSTSILYLKFGTNASPATSTSFTIVLDAKSASGIPAFVIIKGDDYSGEIDGIWVAANGAARITEVV